MYKLFRTLLFQLPPETAHDIALNLLKLLHKLKLTRLFFPALPEKRANILGLSFKNPIGISAGLDNNGDYIDDLASLGVGFIEVGGVTPIAQTGNSKPRIFRIKKAQAIINRMGFSNKGVDYLVKNLKQRKTNCIIGVNIAKNKNTPLDEAHQDYIICLEKIFLHTDFATINISSPNTPGLRELQTEAYLENLLLSVKKSRDELAKKHKKHFPLLVKIAPDLTEKEIETIHHAIKKARYDGIIATNTTLSRTGIKPLKYPNEPGGLSGKPLTTMSRKVLAQLKKIDPEFPVISVGGIDSVQEANTRLALGASLLLTYSAFIYQGPFFLRKLIKFCCH